MGAKKKTKGSDRPEKNIERLAAGGFRGHQRKGRYGRVGKEISERKAKTKVIVCRTSRCRREAGNCPPGGTDRGGGGDEASEKRGGRRTTPSKKERPPP